MASWWRRHLLKMGQRVWAGVPFVWGSPLRCSDSGFDAPGQGTISIQIVSSHHHIVSRRSTHDRGREVDLRPPVDDSRHSGGQFGLVYRWRCCGCRCSFRRCRCVARGGHHSILRDPGVDCDPSLQISTSDVRSRSLQFRVTASFYQRHETRSSSSPCSVNSSPSAVS